ncbi:MAG: DNA-binding response regulator [Thalassobius sp.]|nr:DNA-binding response regulator [Thalassovita sp.]
MDTINIILADDHELVRDGIKSLLSSENGIKVIDEASNGQEALESIAKKQPDVLIIDIRMPELNGIEAVRQVTEKYPAVRTLVLSMHDSEEYVVQSIQAGADGYLLKGSSKAEFLKALNTVATGGKYFTGDISSILIKNFVNGNISTPTQDTSKKPSPTVQFNLTRREKQILDLVLEGKSNKEIGDDLNISKRTAEVHRFNLMKKLDVKNFTELVSKVEELELV